MVTYRGTCESLDNNLSPDHCEKRFIMFISSVRKTAKNSDGDGWTLIYFWEDFVLEFMPKQCQSARTSSSPAWLPKIRFWRNWVSIYHGFTSLMCVLAPKVVCCTCLQNWSPAPLLFPGCSSLCSWSAVRLSCGTLAYTEHQIWENNAENHF